MFNRVLFLHPEVCQYFIFLHGAVLPLIIKELFSAFLLHCSGFHRYIEQGYVFFFKILLAYCLQWVLANITSACILLRISITLSFSPGAYFSSRPLWRVSNACHLPQSTLLPANRQARVTSASSALISIHTLAY